ncbi:hypothetical protein A9236_08665 [Polynucleobacter sp. QLW-P1DATA-2]|uniref:AsmA family protein n=1 Tax=unclassified Polynucleobacter TaxID=2640945 RepID=UPI0008F83C7B|nr:MULTISPECIES: AsmA family protein [unclassified Polynucleobacter]OIN01215.1 hypothetical protein A9236_08665 [Polynucleobacter sp. QLW-P1DATA-2]OIN02785.1 hypothetical protein A9235_03715 [Polynucleobacter sp. MWH-Tro8-2-5-gr]
MNKSLKTILLVLLVILGLGGLGVWYAASSINPAKLTQLISSSVKDATGRELKIAGPVTLRIFPSLAITAEHVSLSNASWASKPEMLIVKHVEVDIKLLPLLSKEVEFNAINLNGVDAYLQTNKAGDGNWDFTPAVTGNTSSASLPASNESTSSSDQSNFIKMRNLVITDARLSYQDFGSWVKRISIPQLSLNGSGDETAIAAQAQYENYQLGLKGKTTSIRQILNDWNVNPIKVNVDLAATLNGKTMNINGDIDKKPQTLPSFNLSLSSKSFEMGSLAGSAALTSPGGAKAPVDSLTKSHGRFLFSEEALPLGELPIANGKLTLNIDELSIPGHVPMTGVKGHFVFEGSKININDLHFGLGKGSADVQASVAQFQSANPEIAIKGLARGFTLEQLMDAVDSNTKVKGGDTEIAFNLRSTGTSMHQLAGKANGAVQLSVGKGSIDSRFIDRGGDLLITIVNSINPMRKKSDQTILECAVVYLPVSNGQIALNDSIGVVTDRLDIVLSGSVDLKTEALNIKIDPREKSGLTTGVNLAGLVKLQGTLLNPKAGVNKEGVVNSAVSIGLGFLTGGATILAENARSIATKNANQPCKAALHPWSDIYPGTN